MRLAPGTPLSIGLLSAESAPVAPVGRLAMASGMAQLEWSPEVLARGHTLSPLHYPLEPGLHAAHSAAFDGLHGFLSDSLPDAWGTLLLRSRLAKLGYRFEELSVVDRLALVGRQSRGALVFQPETLESAATGEIDFDRLAEESRLVLQGEAGELDDLLAQLGGGSGGARPKVHISFGAEDWIVKFPALNDPPDIGPVEEAYASMARAAGINMAETRLIPSATGPGHFGARRFDRPAPGKRVHMVSLGGAVEASPHMPSLDYDGFLRATLSITRDMRDVEQVFRRMVFNVLAHNRDDHVRQHAFLMAEDGRWKLSPAFDLTFSHGPGGEHYMAVEGEGRDVTRGNVEQLGARHGISAKRMLAIIDQVRGAIADWRRVAMDSGVTESLVNIAESLEFVNSQFFAE